MTDARDLKLLRLLAGESSDVERREIERELAADAALRRRFARLETTWNRIELAPGEDAPADFASSVIGRLAKRPTGATAPAAGVRWVAAAALALGVALGMTLGARLRQAPAAAARTIGVSWETTPSLAIDYWNALEETLPDGEDATLERGDSDSESA